MYPLDIHLTKGPKTLLVKTAVLQGACFDSKPPGPGLGALWPGRILSV